MDHIDFFMLRRNTGLMDLPTKYPGGHTAGAGHTPSRFSRLPEPVALELASHPLLAPLLPMSAGYRQGPDHAIGYDVRRAGGEYLIKYCCAGKGLFSAGGRNRVVRPGDLVVLSAPEAHSYRADPADPWAVWWTYFKGPEGQIWTSQLCPPAVPPDDPLVRIINLGHDPVLESAFLQLLLAHEGGYALPRIILAAATLRSVLALCLLRSREQTGTGVRRRSLENLVAWMRQNISGHPGLDDFAHQYGTSRDHCIRDFKASYGYTPMDYFLRLKIQRASELMAVEGLKVNEAARQVGFDDPAYFSRLFSRKTGISPRDFRNLYG